MFSVYWVFMTQGDVWNLPEILSAWSGRNQGCGFFSWESCVNSNRNIRLHNQKLSVNFVINIDEEITF